MATILAIPLGTLDILKMDAFPVKLPRRVVFACADAAEAVFAVFASVF